MHLWTNGETHLVATGRGVARLAAQAGAKGPSETFLRFPLENVPRNEEPGDLELFAVVDPAGTRGVLGRQGGVYAFSFEGKAPSAAPMTAPPLLAAVGWDRPELLVAKATERADGRTHCTLHAATVREASMTIGEPLVLPTAARIDRATGIWAKGCEPWPEEESDPDLDEPFEASELDVKLRHGSWGGVVRLHANPFGVVATGTYGGLVVVLEPGTLRPLFSVRVPTQGEADLFGAATKEGVLIGLVIEGRNSALLHVAPSGKVLAVKTKLGKTPANGMSHPLLLDAARLLVTSDDHAYQVRLPALEVTKLKEPGPDLQILAHASAANQSSHLLAYGEDSFGAPHRWNLRRVEVATDRARLVEVAMPDLRAPERPAPPPAAQGPKRVDGQASLALMATPGAPPWTCRGGDAADLELRLSSTGGRVAGIYVEVAGPALAGGLVTSVEATVGTTTSVFSVRGAAARADLKAVALDAAFARPDGPAKSQPPPPPNPSVDLKVRVRGAKAGQGLLTVRVGPLTMSGTTGSAMQGKNMSVEP